MARARLLLEATSTRAAARRFAEHEAVSPFGGNHEKGLPAQLLTPELPPVLRTGEGGHVYDVARIGLQERGVAHATPRRDLQGHGQAWVRWGRSRPLAALVTACALIALMVVLLSLVKLWTDLLTEIGPLLGA